MVYVQHGASGRLLRVESRPFDGMTGTLALQSGEIEEWLHTRSEMQCHLEVLRQSDQEMLRIMEDVVNLLVERGIIDYGDLPEAARFKLDNRALIRAELEGLVDHMRARGAPAISGDH